MDRAATRAGAAFLFLDSLVGKNGVEAVVLTNDAGLMLASTRGQFDGDHIARAGTAVVAGGVADDDFEGRDVFAHTLHVHGAAYTLVSVGGRVPRLRDVASALARILPPRV